MPLKKAVIIGSSRTNENALGQIKRELQIHVTAFSTNSKTHSEAETHKFTEVVYMRSSFDVWITPISPKDTEYSQCSTVGETQTTEELWLSDELEVA